MDNNLILVSFWTHELLTLIEHLEKTEYNTDEIRRLESLLGKVNG